MEGLFEMIRSGEEGKVQELLDMIRADAYIGSIAAKIEANMKSPEGSQKRKRSVSSASSKEESGAAHRSGSDDHDARRQAGRIEPETVASDSASQPTPYRVTSSGGSIGLTGLTLGLDDQPHPIPDLAQVRASISILAFAALFSYSYRSRNCGAELKYPCS
jgi:hypothetical protein